MYFCKENISHWLSLALRWREIVEKKRKKLLWKKQNKIFKKGNRTSKEQRNERQQKNNNTWTHLLLKNNNTFFETYITYLLVECNLMGIRMYFQVTKQLKLFFSSCISLSLILTVSILLTSFLCKMWNNKQQNTA